MASTDGQPLTQRDPEPDIEASERTPLISRSSNEQRDAETGEAQRERSAQSPPRSLSGGDEKPAKRRWPSLLALLLLCILAITIMVFAFIAPSVVEQYAQQAITFEPESLSIDSFTSSGVRARIQGDLVMDASRVDKKFVRDLGRFGTWIAREVESGRSFVEVSLPEYGNVLLGTAQVPPIKVGIQNGDITHVDFVSDLHPGDVDGIRRIAHDYLNGRLGQLRVLGEANVPLKSGLFSLGKQSIRQEMLFANEDVPKLPSYKIKKLNFREEALPSGRGMAADVALVVKNDYPVDFTIPPLGFAIKVAGCNKNDPYIMLADALTHDLYIHPKQDVELNVTGNVRRLPDTLTEACPGSHESPLDAILGKYLHGKDAKLYVQGSDSPSQDTPQWITDIISSITVPVALPGRTFGSLIKNFTLADTHFSLPDPFASPNTPASNPRISAKVQAIVALPEEMNFNISVSRVRADADVYYKGKKLGKLDLHQWQKASSDRIEPISESDGPTLMVESLVRNAPLNITDEDLFTDVLQAMLFGGRGVMLQVKAEVDVETETALGAFVIRKIPAEGQVPVQPITPGSGISDPNNPIITHLKPKIFNLAILDTAPHSLTLSALVNLTNPTKYTATVPYIDINILTNGTLLGHATVRNLEMGLGHNAFIPVTAVWEPYASNNGATGRELLSQYISGLNTTLTLQTSAASIPSLPSLGRALSKFNVTFPTPRLGSTPPSHDHPPHDPADPVEPGKDDQKPHFIKDATMHLITSTATFTLLSPLSHNTLFITSINATAFYHDEVVGTILYDLPFAVPPVDSHGEGIVTPRLPVDWNLGSVGFEAVKGALGGTLKLKAEADVGVKVGRWGEEVWFRGGEIGAKVRL
nr:hypothetical protein B0A51_11897 [Rachicladosporium sp. CCFEE 5018]